MFVTPTVGLGPNGVRVNLSEAHFAASCSASPISALVMEKRIAAVGVINSRLMLGIGSMSSIAQVNCHFVVCAQCLGTTVSRSPRGKSPSNCQVAVSKSMNWVTFPSTAPRAAQATNAIHLIGTCDTFVNSGSFSEGEQTYGPCGTSSKDISSPMGRY